MVDNRERHVSGASASILMLVPDVEEIGPLLSSLVERQVACEPVRIGPLSCTSIPALDMLVAEGGVGKAEFAVRTQFLIDRCRSAKLAMCVGAAGGLADSVAIGDVVVATSTIEHDYKERFKPEPLPSHPGDADTLAQLRHVVSARSFPFQVHFGPVASGDEDIVNRDRATQLHIETQALCAAWEGSGGGRAARFSGIGFLEMRVITDTAGPDAATLFHEHTRTVMPHVVELLLAWRAGLQATA